MVVLLVLAVIWLTLVLGVVALCSAAQRADAAARRLVPCAPARRPGRRPAPVGGARALRRAACDGASSRRLARRPSRS